VKRAAAAIFVVVLAFAAVGVASAVVGTPEVDQADATFHLTPTSIPTETPCAGEDGVTYSTVSGVWKGTETDTSPGTPDYSLTGKLKIVATLTISNSNGTGVGTGTATLTRAGAKIYSGKFTAIVQITNPTTGAAEARGFFNASFFSGGTATGDSLLANFELTISDTATATIDGRFGGPSSMFDYSAEYNNKTC
jgi:hypothetical protein